MWRLSNVNNGQSMLVMLRTCVQLELLSTQQCERGLLHSYFTSLFIEQDDPELQRVHLRIFLESQHQNIQLYWILFYGTVNGRSQSFRVIHAALSKPLDRAEWNIKNHAPIQAWVCIDIKLHRPLKVCHHLENKWCARGSIHDLKYLLSTVITVSIILPQPHRYTSTIYLLEISRKLSGYIFYMGTHFTDRLTVASKLFISSLCVFVTSPGTSTKPWRGKQCDPVLVANLLGRHWLWLDVVSAR